jgi:hypothetical protein
MLHMSYKTVLVAAPLIILNAGGCAFTHSHNVTLESVKEITPPARHSPKYWWAEESVTFRLGSQR